jgi:cytidylate kinase
MYRAVTWAAIAQGISVQDEGRVSALAERLRIDVIHPTIEDGRQYTVLADGQDVTWEIRRPVVNGGVSPVSAYPGVRAALTVQQRRIGRQGCIVMVGRDIGTVVLPEADLKIYLDATVEERAERRYREEVARGEATEFDLVLASVRRRDEIDSGRALAPLRAAEDAVVIDTTNLDVDQVVERVLALMNGWSAEE